MNVRILAIFMMIFMTSPAVWAAQHGHADPSPHGGEMASVGNMHLELVVKPGELRVYVMDHNDKALDAKGGMASALVQAGGKTIKIDLAVDGGNAFIGKGNFEMAAGMVVVVSFTLPGKKTENARFRPKL